MTSITTDLSDVLSSVRCDGDFYVVGATEIAAPNLSVDGVGLLSLPFQQGQLEQLIASASLAPFGRGVQTIVDTAVRKTWQIDAAHLHFGGRHWQTSLDAIVAAAAAGLGVSDPVTAQLYKLLIYDTGSFFVEHRDTEKQAGMFATLVIVLPSVYAGGELLIRHRDREVCLPLACPDPSDAAFVAFYADCVHEVRPVTSGTRLTLIYNLIRSGNAGAASPPQYPRELAALAAMLSRWAGALDTGVDDLPQKLVYPLEHAYSAAELGFHSLKNADAAAAKVLAAATELAGCDLYLAQVAIEESGSAEHDGYDSRRYRRYRDEDEGFEVCEVIDRSATVSGWCQPDGGVAPIGELPLHDNELCPPDALEDADPDEQHFHEATGNEGASFERSYRRAALVLWPRARRLAVINQGALASTLAYLEELSTRAGAEVALALATLMVRTWPERGGARGEDAARLLACLCQLEAARLIDTFVAAIPASGCYDGAENAALAQALRLLPAPRAAELITAVIAANATYAPGACAALLAACCVGSEHALDALAPAARTLVDALTGALPKSQDANRWRRVAPPDAALVVHVLTALQRQGDAALADVATDHMLAAYAPDAVLVAAALEFDVTLRAFAPAARLRASALAHLRARIAMPLAAPQDHRRPSMLSCNCEYCVPLARFLADPERANWTLKAAETHRRHVARTIADDRCDVDHVTLKRGSPHELVCTKNTASYQRRVAERVRDQDAVRRLAGGAPPA
ncbi:MAG: 2OG-Fe(II) oxygenase [Pseudomonadota bacterium]|nr:2OG-Fe(II) oxygenase [Pseudomonadota bacterium]